MKTLCCFLSQPKRLTRARESSIYNLGQNKMEQKYPLTPKSSMKLREGQNAPFARYREDICLQTLLLLFKYANHRNKRPFVSTVNEAVVGTLMAIGDVNDIFPITELLQPRGKENAISLPSLLILWGRGGRSSSRMPLRQKTEEFKMAATETSRAWKVLFIPWYCFRLLTVLKDVQKMLKEL